MEPKVGLILQQSQGALKTQRKTAYMDETTDGTNGMNQRRNSCQEEVTVSPIKIRIGSDPFLRLSLDCSVCVVGTEAIHGRWREEDSGGVLCQAKWALIGAMFGFSAHTVDPLSSSFIQTLHQASFLCLSSHCLPLSFFLMSVSQEPVGLSQINLF